MKNNVLSLVAFSMLTALVSLTQAQATNARTIEQCDKSFTDNVAYSQCLDNVSSLAERELTAWVNNKMFELEELASATGRSGALNMFKKSQKSFERFRENNCKFYYLELSPGTGASAAYKKCFINTTKMRIDELSKLGS